MKKQIKNNQLKSFIHIESGIIPKDTCKFVIDTIKNSLWSKHTWGDDKDKNNTYSYSTKELDVLPITKDLEDILNPLISLSVKFYNDFIGEEKVSKVTQFSPIRFNRYQKSQTMRKHCDHIRDLFEGEIRGIPILSIIINFNDDYKVNLGEGDIVIFPSLFLFPHRVEEVTENIRYSGVSWGV